MAGYSARQSSFTTGDTITAAHSNDEFNQVLSAFNATTGHTHDGTAGEGGPIGSIRDADALNKVLVDSTNNHLEFYVEVSSAAVQQLRIQDGAIVPITDNDIDLGTSSLEFKDLFIDGTANIDAINYNGTAISATAAELNILDGVTATASELNVLDGITAVVGELNALDIGSTAVGTAVASKAVILDSNKDYTGIRNLTLTGDLTVGGDDITMGTNTAGNILVADGTNFNSIAAGSLSEISTVASDDVFIAVDTSGGGLKKITRSTLVSGLATSGAISNVVEDTSPQLGANLDTNSHNILIDDAHGINDENGNEQIIFQTTSSAVNQFDITNAATGNPPKISTTGGDSNIDLDLEAKGTGHVTVRGNTNSGAIQFNCESNSHGQIVIAQPHSAAVTNTLTLPAGSSSTLVSLVSTDTLTNKTLTSPVINTGTFGTSILPTSADGTTLGSASKEFSDLFLADAGTIQFGNDQDITLTHDADVGLKLKHAATADNKPIVLTLQTGETDMAANDVMGAIRFQAPDEGTGTDAILIAAAIQAVAEGDFSSSNNATTLEFHTGASEAASSKMTLSSAGLLTIADDLMIKDGGTIGVASTNDALTISSAGIVTFKDDILIKDGGTIGSASDADAIAIGSDGDVTLTQDLELQHDGAILSFGANDEVTLTHVHDDGLLLNTDMQLQFRDSAINIRSDADGDLDINADDEVEINSTLIDVNGNLDVSGTLTQAGVATFSVAANVAQVALSSSSNAVAWDASAAANAFHVTTENTTFSAPSNAVEGAFIALEINYNGSHTIAFNTVFEFAASTAPTFTSTDGKTDILVFRYNGAVWQEVGRTLNLSES
jgi:hypothetical protein